MNDRQTTAFVVVVILSFVLWANNRRAADGKTTVLEQLMAAIQGKPEIPGQTPIAQTTTALPGGTSGATPGGITGPLPQGSLPPLFVQIPLGVNR